MRQVLKHRNLTVNTTQNRERPQLSPSARAAYSNLLCPAYNPSRSHTCDQNTTCWLLVRAHLICAAHIFTSTRKRSGWMVWAKTDPPQVIRAWQEHSTCGCARESIEGQSQPAVNPLRSVTGGGFRVEKQSRMEGRRSSWQLASPLLSV